MFSWLIRIFHTWLDYPLRPGTVLHNRYRIEQFLADGSFGLAYLGADLQADERVVLIKQQRVSKGQRAEQYLQKEYEILGKFNSAEIPRAYDFFNERNRSFLVSQYIDGITFEVLLFERDQSFTLEQALDYTEQLLLILSEVHTQEYVHLDVRLPNVLIRDHSVYLIDFGLARRVGDHPDEAPYAEGKLAYRHLAEPQSDLYAVGHFLLYLLYSAYRPVEESDVDGGWEEELNLTENLRGILRKLLKIDPPFASASDALREIQKIKNRS